ncbi:hypothetical protein ACSBR1_039082 [Camellia fascicularis]
MEAGMPLTQEELSWQALGQKKNYLHEFGIGPRPFSPYDSAVRARDKHMEAMRAEIEVFHEKLDKDYEELMKEKEEPERS